MSVALVGFRQFVDLVHSGDDRFAAAEDSLAQPPFVFLADRITNRFHHFADLGLLVLQGPHSRPTGFIANGHGLSYVLRLHRADDAHQLVAAGFRQLPDENGGYVEPLVAVQRT